MKFIGRRRELESLETAYQTDGGFVVIYGRRRVGKTTLIKEFIKDKLAFYFLATEEVESQIESGVPLHSPKRMGRDPQGQ